MISSEKLIELYTAMVKCRLLAERASKLAHGVKLRRNLEAGVGREATIAGVALDLLPKDTVSTSSEDLASSCLRGSSLNRMLQNLGTNGNAAAGSKAIDRLSDALSAAKAHKAAKNGKVAVAFYDSSKSSQTQWRKKLTTASADRLPILFVCHSELSNAMSTADTINGNAPQALAFGVPLITVDGNDVVAVYRVASESIARARQGRGPTLIECLTYSCPDHRDGRREKNSQPPSQDPITIMENYLSAKRLFSTELKRKIESTFSRRLERATGLTGK